ncbi:MAG: hypothetical protein RMK93_06525, partial [Bacteroidota bacterium]|nr:hypothetical protein [Bacteroidota bacterium]
MIIALVVLGVGVVIAQQNVGIGTNAPHSSALLDLESTTQGLLVPRMTQAQRNAIASPATGLIIYQTDNNPGFYYHNGTTWIPLLSSVSGSGLFWALGGNTVTNPATQWLGTQNNQPLIIRTDGTERMRITAGGQVGIGVTTPSERLEVAGNIGLRAGAAAFMGTVDNFGLSLRTNNADRVSISTAGDVTVVSGHVLVQNTDNTARQVRLYEPSGSGTNYTAFQAQAQAADIVYTLPASIVASGVLQTDASGNLTWTTTLSGLETDPQVGTLSDGQVAYWAGGAGGALTGSNQLFWDATNNRLRVGGTTAPVERLEVAGNIGLRAGAAAFMGTVDNNRLELRVNNQASLILNPPGSAAPAWSIQRDAGGNTRGLYAVDLQVSRGSVSQVASGNNSVICGGSNNTASGTMSVIGGGEQNSAIGSTSTVSGGSYNVAQGGYSTVGGGYTNTAGSTGATVGGGTSNTAGGQYSTISGGQSNTISPGEYSTISGGQSNTITGNYSAIAGGYNLRLGGRSFGFSGQSSTTQTNLSTNSNIAAFVDVDLWLYNRSNTARQLRFYVPTTDATGNAPYTAFRASSSQTTTISYVLPPTLTATTTVGAGLLQTDGSGNLSWVSPSAVVGGSGWALTGNAGTNPGVNFLGTTDNQPLVIRTNNTERLRVTEAGWVGIGTTSPTGVVEVIETSGGFPRGIIHKQVSSDVVGAHLALFKARGTLSSPAAMQANDVGGVLSFGGYNGSDYVVRAAVRGVAAENWSGTAQGMYLSFWTTPIGGTTEVERMRITAAGDVGIGTSTPANRLHVQDGSIIVQHDANTPWSAALHFRKGRGTQSSPTIVQSDDETGYIYFRGYDGSQYQPAALIVSHVDGVPGANDMPGRLSFWTTPDGSGTSLERLRITNQGDVQIVSGNLEVRSVGPAQQLRLYEPSGSGT